MTDSLKFEQAIALVRQERLRQDVKWGADREQHDMIWLTILAEEFGETAEAILKTQPVETTDELVQVAAVAVAWLENRLRRGETGQNGIAWTLESKIAFITSIGPAKIVFEPEISIYRVEVAESPVVGVASSLEKAVDIVFDALEAEIARLEKIDIAKLAND